MLIGYIYCFIYFYVYYCRSFVEYNVVFYFFMTHRVHETRRLFADRTRAVRAVWQQTSVRARRPHGAGSFQSSKSPGHE